MKGYSGKYYIDGIDIWSYGLVVSRGMEDFLQYPGLKEGISHDYPDANGVNIDTSTVYLKERDINLHCSLLATSEDQFWTRYQNLITNLTKPGKRRIEVTALGQRHYFCIYQKTNAFEKVTKIAGTDLIGCKFVLQFLENEPEPANGQVFLVDEEGHFLLT